MVISCQYEGNKSFYAAGCIKGQIYILRLIQETAPTTIVM